MISYHYEKIKQASDHRHLNKMYTTSTIIDKTLKKQMNNHRFSSHKLKL